MAFRVANRSLFINCNSEVQEDQAMLIGTLLLQQFTRATNKKINSVD